MNGLVTGDSFDASQFSPPSQRRMMTECEICVWVSCIFEVSLFCCRKQCCWLGQYRGHYIDQDIIGSVQMSTCQGPNLPTQASRNNQSESGGKTGSAFFGKRMYLPLILGVRWFDKTTHIGPSTQLSTWSPQRCGSKWHGWVRIVEGSFNNIGESPAAGAREAGSCLGFRCLKW